VEVPQIDVERYGSADGERVSISGGIILKFEVSVNVERSPFFESFAIMVLELRTRC
jgi:hypothetical protein